MNWSLSICCSPSICYSKYLSKCNQNRSCSYCWIFQFSWIFLPSMNPFPQSQTQLHPWVWHSQLSFLSSVFVLSTASQTSVPTPQSKLGVPKVHRVWSFLKIMVLITFLLDVIACSSPKTLHCCCISIKRTNTGFVYFLKTSLYGTHSHF